LEVNIVVVVSSSTDVTRKMLLGAVETDGVVIVIVMTMTNACPLFHTNNASF